MNAVSFTLLLDDTSYNFQSDFEDLIGFILIANILNILKLVVSYNFMNIIQTTELYGLKGFILLCELCTN